MTINGLTLILFVGAITCLAMWHEAERENRKLKRANRHLRDDAADYATERDELIDEIDYTLALFIDSEARQNRKTETFLNGRGNATIPAARP